MFEGWELQGSDQLAVTVTGIATVCYLAFHYGASPGAVRRLFRDMDDSLAAQDRVRTGVAFWRRVWGVIVLGVVALSLAIILLPGSLGNYGLSLALPNAADSLLAIGILGPIQLLIVFAASRGPGFSGHYPEARMAVWSRRDWWLNTLSWGAYLLAYEAFFRGLLLFGLAAALGPWPALVLATALYAFAHLPKNPAETLATLPVGFVYGAVALSTGSILMPFVVHWVGAVFGDTLAVRRHPEMRFGKR